MDKLMNPWRLETQDIKTQPQINQRFHMNAVAVDGNRGESADE